VQLSLDEHNKRVEEMKQVDDDLKYWAENEKSPDNK